MIEVTVKEEAERRGIKNAYGLAIDLKISQSKAARLWKADTLPELETINDICRKWGCDLGALLRCVPEPAQKKTRTGKKS